MKLVIIGGSAGSLDPLKTVLRDLPAGLDAAVLVLRHSGPDHPSLLTGILDRVCPMPVTEAGDGDSIAAGHVYVAPPGRHVSVHGRRLKVRDAPSGKGVRPDIDLALESAAASYGEDCVGVILSGLLDDGTAGAIRLAQVGGSTLVQDPAEAEQSSMPDNVIARDHPDRVLSSVGLGRAILDFVNGDVPDDVLAGTA